MALQRGRDDRQLLAGRRLEGHLGARGRQRAVARGRRRPDRVPAAGAARPRVRALDEPGPATAAAAASVLARIAHELYWLGRNVARAEHTARMLEGIYQADLQGRPDDPVGVTLSWGALLAIMGAGSEAIGRRGRSRHPRPRAGHAHARRRQPALGAVVRRARPRGRAHGPRRHQRRDVGGHQHVPPQLRRAHRDGRAAFRPVLDVELRQGALRAVLGLAGRTMLRDEAYAFLEAGGRFESADMVLRMLRVALPPGHVARRRGVPGPRRPGAGAAAGGGRSAGLPARRGGAAERDPGGALPALHANPTRTRSPLRSTPCAGAQCRRRQPARLRAGAAPVAPVGRPRVPRRRRGQRRRTAGGVRDRRARAEPHRSRRHRALLRRHAGRRALLHAH